VTRLKASITSGEASPQAGKVFVMKSEGKKIRNWKLENRNKFK